MATLLQRTSLKLMLCNALLVSLCACQKEPVVVPPTNATMTVMIYCDADNDLEQAQLATIGELSKGLGGSAAKEKIRVVALIDRAEKDSLPEGYTDAAVLNQPNWTTAKLFEIEQGSLSELADWGELNMADGASLARLLKVGQRQFPAEHYVLVMMDHGNAWAGFCGDDTAPQESDLLSPLEVHQALETEGFNQARPLDLLITDACLMGNLEFLCRIRKNVRQVVTSEETISEAGLQYSKAFVRTSRLLDHPVEVRTKSRRPSGQRLPFNGSQLPQFFATQMLKENRPDNNPEVTQLCLLKLDKIAAVADALRTVSSILQKELESDSEQNWKLLSQARSRSLQFGESGMVGAANAEVRDIVDLCHQFSKVFPAHAPEFQRLAKSVQAVLVAESQVKTIAKASGLTIFFPPMTEHTSELSASDYYQELDPDLREWGKFVKYYTGLERSSASRSELEDLQLSSRELFQGEPIDVQSRIKSPEELDRCEFLVIQSDRVLNCVPSFPAEESTLIRDEFDGSALALGEKYGAYGQVWCPLKELIPSDEDDDDPDLAIGRVKAQLMRKSELSTRPDSKAWLPVTLEFEFQTKSGALRGNIKRVVRSGTSPSQVTLEAGDRLRLVYELLGTTRSVYGEEMILHEPRWLVVRYAKLPEGKYNLGFRIQDYSGKSRLKLASVDLKAR
jgi:hypothetical protein